jgi:hypothetical protein
MLFAYPKSSHTSIVAKKKLELIFLGAKNHFFFYLFFWKQHLINFLKTLKETIYQAMSYSPPLKDKLR